MKYTPHILLGIGQWEQIQDVFLLSSGQTYTAGNTGGSVYSIVMEQNHGISNTDYMFVGKTTSSTGATRRVSVPSTGSVYGYTTDSAISIAQIEYTGYRCRRGTGANMPPYLVVFMWKRTG